MNERHMQDSLQDWQSFVLDNGWGAYNYELAAVLGRTEKEVASVKNTGACTRHSMRKRFSELFLLWHGRVPDDADWPPPRLRPKLKTYEWQGREDAWLATLVGRFSKDEIVRMLTDRLQAVTGDPQASRNAVAVQDRISQIGLQVREVIGGISPADAGREIGSLAIVHQAIQQKQVRTERVGTFLVIPRDEWAAWKAKRRFPPPGYVQLSSIRTALGIRSDKLSEFARMEFIPTAIRCNPLGTKGPSTQFGTWYIDEKVAKKLVADRHAGLPMPWHGRAMPDNLRATFKLWQQRKHPTYCPTCAEIWGKQGAPASFEEYADRYPALAFGAKRHLTRKWDPGFTIADLAKAAGCSVHRVRQAIANGALEAIRLGKPLYISRTEATLWRQRRCPVGTRPKEWISVANASDQYLFTPRQLRQLINDGTLKSKVGTTGKMRDTTYVNANQCAKLRAKLGFTEEEAARRVGVTVPRLRVLLEGVNWRKASGIPLDTVKAVIKRLESKHGYTVDEAANALGRPAGWVHQRIQDGAIRVVQAKWDRRRVYITEPMFRRLQEATETPTRRRGLGPDWLRLSEAAFEAGVTAATIVKWASANELKRRMASNGWRYHREAVRARARKYWPTCRLRRAVPPAWFTEEAKAAGMAATG